MKNYLENIKKMVDDLNKNPKINVTEFVINLPATEEELNGAEKKLKLTADMKEFYSQANGIKLTWELKEPVLEKSFIEEYNISNEKLMVCGTIELLPVQEVFMDWKDVIYFDWEGGDEYKLLHPLDFFTSGACAALNIDGSASPVVYFHYCGEEMNSLKMDFKEYLNALLKTRGFNFWQSAIIAEYKGEELTLEPKIFRACMPVLFPDYKLSEILKK